MSLRADSRSAESRVGKSWLWIVPKTCYTVSEKVNATPGTTAIAAGVSIYDHLTRLRGPELDVGTMREVLCTGATGLMPTEAFVSLENPSASDLREAVTAYTLGRSAAGDVLIFYFSGHALPLPDGDLGLCCTDAAPHPLFQQPLVTNLVRFGDIVQTLASAKVEPVMILDTCYSGQAGVEILRLDLRRRIQAETGSSYALLCSSTRIDVTPDGPLGGPFSAVLREVSTVGMGDRQHRRRETLSLRDLYPGIRDGVQGAYDGVPQLYIGDTLHDVPIVRNTQHRPLQVTLTAAHRTALREFWDNGNPREVLVADLQRLGSSVHTTYRKLGYGPAWALVEEGHQGARRLSKRGVQFMGGEFSIPNAIQKDPSSGEWQAVPGARMISSTDL